MNMWSDKKVSDFLNKHYENKQKDYWFMMFFFIAFLSMLNEDTLETHAGVTFFSYFYSLFLFARDNKWMKTDV